MRKWLCVPMIALCLTLAACGAGDKENDGTSLRAAYREMSGCTMEAVVSCGPEDWLWQARLTCTYTPQGESCVEVLEPESIAGVRAKITGKDLQFEFEELCLNAGLLSQEEISPMVCLPRLMSALQNGWLLEENQEKWESVPCLRLTLDESGQQGGKILSTLWLREEDGLPLRGEIAVEGEIILTAEFTSFAFCDRISD